MNILNRSVCPILNLLWLVGCSSHECTAEAEYSVVVTVVDANQAPLTDAQVAYSINGGQATPCTSGGADYVCGTEAAGVFVITATRANQVGSATLSVSKNECHVITQKVQIVIH
jgi:hypothetical protein